MLVASLLKVHGGSLSPNSYGQGHVRAFGITESLLKRLSTMVIAKNRELSSEAHNHGACASNIIVRHPFERLYCTCIDDST
jgi:hypothetical protein